MKQLIISSLNRVKKAVPIIEDRIKVNIIVRGNHVSIRGSELNEFLVEKIVLAIDFGFDIEDALLLLTDRFDLSFINIKEHTPRKNISEVRARLIGTDGRAKKTIELLVGGAIVVQLGTVGIIVDAEHRSQAVQGIISLIQGAKHGNVFAYLEKQNANLNRARFNSDDLGLRDEMKKYLNE